jgi:hypothetical protein
MMSDDQGNQPLQPWTKSLFELEREFEHSKSEIISLRFETEEEGKERARREAHGRATRRDGEEIGVVRFASQRDIDAVREHLLAAQEAIPDLEAMFSAKVPTEAFLVTWGSFS